MEFGGENEEKKNQLIFQFVLQIQFTTLTHLPTQTSYTSQAIYELLFS